ncbi:MBL fold metallo-hydrolase [Desmonostoc muscorum LEGE 12446]|uniref:MBL fold metallo-hydrolase n=1 Tax=Desmonostoc muscorum LEGE 12446 TaxID=1828758 RepID=A0A8J6ZR27_DESMC|nr:MBL fold metallo-hydrolase [Desmonostoc muscorum]MCF2146578.1 MBL fold metallo-hydrolase [Desmonostoc muscorum LEGE 12446]
MIKLIFLGSGSAFTVGADNFQSNILLVNGQEKKLLIDCGSDIRFSLHSADFSYLDITDIYISHLHADHVGGLEYIGFSTKFDSRCQKPKLYLSKELASAIWENTLSGGMKSIQGDIASLETYFDVNQIERNGCFTWAETKFILVKVIHVNNGYFVMPSYGLFFEINGKKIFITTDTQLCLEQIGKYYEQADIIFQDCETSQFPTSIHAHYNKLLTLPAELKNKMWLYGYQPGLLPDAQKDGFCGFIKRGQIFDFCSK